MMSKQGGSRHQLFAAFCFVIKERRGLLAYQKGALKGLRGDAD
jgi:hypothetical protein